MSDDVAVSYSDLEAALMWVSGNDGLETAAFISKKDGAIYYTSADGGADDEEPPDDIDDPDLYWQVPHKNDLDLGRSLALGFVQEAMPKDYDAVRAYFSRSGAYARFKDLLDRRGQLERWFAYEEDATREALRQWAAECGLRIADEATNR